MGQPEGQGDRGSLGRTTQEGELWVKSTAGLNARPTSLPGIEASQGLVPSLKPQLTSPYAQIFQFPCLFYSSVSQ